MQEVSVFFTSIAWVPSTLARHRVEVRSFAEWLNEWGGGVDGLLHCVFFPRSLQGTDFFLTITPGFWNISQGDETNTFSCVQDSSAEHYQGNHIPILEAQAEAERCDWSLDFLQAAKLPSCSFWWPRTRGPCQGETEQDWPDRMPCRLPITQG